VLNGEEKQQQLIQELMECRSSRNGN
jgi:hypothetical protein